MTGATGDEGTPGGTDPHPSGHSPGRTPDGRYVVVDGRRWRASDPAIPERFRTELVAELMAARRSVGAHESGARPRVQDAKVALGERGEPWWDEPTADGRGERAAAAARALLRHRGPDATICPSDVARVVGGERWRSTMAAVRAVVSRLQGEGTVRVTQRVASVDMSTARGPVRIGRGPSWS